MSVEDRKKMVDALADEVDKLPSLVDKLRSAQEAYSPDGRNPNPSMFQHVSGVVERIERMRKAENRARTMKASARKSSRRARRNNRR